MTKAVRHQGKPKVGAGAARTSRTKMNASLAMVVCFVGFQGIVPQSWESASAVSSENDRAADPHLAGDGANVTGIVGSPLLAPFDAAGTTDPTIASGDPAYGTVEGTTTTTTATTDAAAGATRRPEAGTLFAPLDVLTPTSSFGLRTSPITGQAGEFHTGQDYSAPCGTPVFAADAGTVRAVGWHLWGGGNRVEIDHGNGLITSYNHLQSISVTVGDPVNGGDPIAEIGTTGSSTGCHLHFETILDGEHVDPLRWRLVSTEHGERNGEPKDYTPGAPGVGDIPAWAQSSTRSDQPAMDEGYVPVAADLPDFGLGDSLLGGMFDSWPGSPVTPGAPDRPEAPTGLPTPGGHRSPTAETTPAPAPQPTTPKATPTPAPPAQPTTPKATPTPAPTAQPTTPKATPTPAPAPQPTTPKATPQPTTPKATPQPTTPAPTAQPTTPATPPPAPQPTTPATPPPASQPTTPATPPPASQPTTPDATPDSSCDTDPSVTDPTDPASTSLLSGMPATVAPRGATDTASRSGSAASVPVPTGTAAPAPGSGSESGKDGDPADGDCGDAEGEGAEAGTDPASSEGAAAPVSQ